MSEENEDTRAEVVTELDGVTVYVRDADAMKALAVAKRIRSLAAQKPDAPGGECRMHLLPLPCATCANTRAVLSIGDPPPPAPETGRDVYDDEKKRCVWVDGGRCRTHDDTGPGSEEHRISMLRSMLAARDAELAKVRAECGDLRDDNDGMRTRLKVAQREIASLRARLEEARGYAKEPGTVNYAVIRDALATLSGKPAMAVVTMEHIDAIRTRLDAEKAHADAAEKEVAILRIFRDACHEALDKSGRVPRGADALTGILMLVEQRDAAEKELSDARSETRGEVHLRALAESHLAAERRRVEDQIALAARLAEALRHEKTCGTCAEDSCSACDVCTTDAALEHFDAATKERG